MKAIDPNKLRPKIRVIDPKLLRTPKRVVPIPPPDIIVSEDAFIVEFADSGSVEISPIEGKIDTVFVVWINQDDGRSSGGTVNLYDWIDLMESEVTGWNKEVSKEVTYYFWDRGRKEGSK